MNNLNDLSRCVRCGACKALCPTYMSALDETMGARGRVAMLGALTEGRLAPTINLSDKIFSCMLCEACKDICPTGINISEAVYRGRTALKDVYKRGRFIRTAVKYSLPRMDSAFFILKTLRKLLYPLLYRTGRFRYIPEIVSYPFKEISYVPRLSKKTGRVALFVGCSVNYLYQHLGGILMKILVAKGYEVVILKGEVCCGAPLRSFGLDEEAAQLARKNIELFSKLRTDAVISMCPTCTMTIKDQYPALVGDSIDRVMDINEFFISNDITADLAIADRALTYHDPCHLRYGLGITEEPRKVIKNIQGAHLIEMQNPGECCGFGGFFSLDFRDLSRTIGEKKIRNILNTGADTVVTSCPGCMMQLEDLNRQANSRIRIMHIVELVAEGMHTKKDHFS